jgi:hypothetical protein
MLGQDWRPDFSSDLTRRELEIIKNDLHCNAVRICGESIERLVFASEIALGLGLEVWASPELWDRSHDETLDYITEAARALQALKRDRVDQLVLIVASEVTLFTQGIVEGNTVFERLWHPTFWESVSSGAHNPKMNAFLASAATSVRTVFDGPVTYASIPLEDVDWSLFDFVGVDLYREARIREGFTQMLQPYFGHGRPVVITEFGCCTYRGAGDDGGRGFMIADYTSTPVHLTGDPVRDEAEQARELTDMLSIFDTAGVAGTFMMTFVSPLNPTSANPMFDMDMASYSLVKSYMNDAIEPLSANLPHATRKQRVPGTPYADLPWDPKQSFTAVAEYYDTAARRK